MGAWLRVLALLWALAHVPLAYARASSVESNQARFERGLQYLLDQNHAAAVRVFEALYQDTKSERVRLEWARAAHLARDYASAERLFRAVLAASPPPAVRENIQVFLRDIALARGSFDYAFSLVRDTNPRALPGVRTFTLWGLPFEYTPQVDDSPQWGLNYRLSFSQGLDQARRWIGSVGLLGTHFADSEMSRHGFDTHLTYKVPLAQTLHVRASHEHMDMGSDPWYRYTWLTLLHRSHPAPAWRWRQELRHGVIEFPRSSFQNSTLISYHIGLERQLTPWLAFGAEGGWSNADAAESPYTHSGFSHAISATAFVSSLRTRVQIKYSSADRNHRSPDPMFGITRQDTRQTTTISVEPFGLRLRGLIPTFELGQEQTASTLPLHNHERVIANMTFRRAF